MSKIGVLAQEVLDRKTQGVTNSEIAKQLGVSEKYVASVIKKHKLIK